MKKTFTILHTNDMHSAFIGLGPVSDYNPFALNGGKTRGGYARLAAVIAKRREAAATKGPVLVLDAGDYSMGTAFAAATRETGCELQLMSRMGYDATTLGNHEFDLGPDGLGKSIGVAAKAGRAPAVLASNTNLMATETTLVDLQRLAKEGVIRRHLVIERGGVRFGIFGVLGKEAQIFAGIAVRLRSSDAVEAARECGEDSARDGEGGPGRRPQSRRSGEGQGRQVPQRRRRSVGRGGSGHRRGDRRPAIPSCARRSSSTTARPWSRRGRRDRIWASWSSRWMGAS